MELDPGVDRIRDGDLIFTDCGVELLPLEKEVTLRLPHMLQLHGIQLQDLFGYPNKTRRQSKIAPRTEAPSRPSEAPQIFQTCRRAVILLLTF